METATAARSPAPVARGVAIGLLAVGGAVLALHAVSFLPFVGDDALISLRYARRLLDGQGLTWTDGERVEGYSNLLWVLGCAGLGAIGFDLIAAARVLGFAGSLAAIAAVLALVPPRRGGPLLPALVGPLALALAPPIALWTIGGLAPPLVIALLGWSLVALAAGRRTGRPAPFWLAGALLGLLALTRPDGGLFGALAVAWLWLRGARRGALVVALPLLAAIAGQMLFRLTYYGDWLPNTAYVKAEPGLDRALYGLQHYTLPGLLALGGAVPLAVAGAWAVGTRRDRTGIGGLALLCLLAWTAYVTAVGGDYMPAWRHFCPALLLAAILAAIGAEAIAKWRPASAWARHALWAAPFLLLLGLGQLWDGETGRARSEQWEWDGQTVGGFLAQAFGDARPLLAVEAAGTVPYFSGLPCLDLLGLNDRHIARQPPRPDLYPPSHDHGDGDYVLKRQPDLVLLATPGGAFLGQSLSAVQMQRDPRFARDYRFCTFETPEGFRTGIWVRLAGRAGIRRDPDGDGIFVPGHLLGSLHLGRLGDDPRSHVTAHRRQPPVAGTLDAGGRLQAELRAAEAFLHELPLAAGHWHVTVEPAASDLRAALHRPGGGPLPQTGGTFRLEGPGPVDLRVAGDGRRRALVGVRLRRL